MAKPDEAHRMTDVELALLEKRIAKLYKEAADELQGTIDEYFKKLEERDKHQQELLAAGKITEQQYIQWRLAQIARGSRFEALRDLIAYRYSNANAVAINYANDSTASIYALNRNYITWELEQDGYDVQTWTIFDEHTVKRLIKDDPDLMPYYPKEKALKRGIDLDYGRKRITDSVTSGILQGLSIGKIADKLQEELENMNRASAIRTARTAVTEAQNAGRQDGFEAAAKMGIYVEKRWIATIDNRTRHAHGMADGQIVDFDKPFMVGGYPMMYPGDHSALGHLVYNCRCTMARGKTHGATAKVTTRRIIDPKTGKSIVVPNEPYSVIMGRWKEEDPEFFAKWMKMGQNRSADNKQWTEYRKLLGNNIPSTLVAFQDMKYNNTERWEYLKRFASYKRKYPTSNKRYFDVSEELKKQNIDKGIVLPPVQHRAYILPEGKKEPYHIMRRMAERNITDDEVRGYMENAKMMFVQWGGKRRLYVSKEGCCIITREKDSWIYKTAWKKADDDEDFDAIRRAMKNARL